MFAKHCAHLLDDEIANNVVARVVDFAIYQFTDISMYIAEVRLQYP